MIKYVFLFFSVSILYFAQACTSIERCAQNNVYTVEYSSSGGITGIQNGKTIDCRGRVLFWKKYPNSNKTITDSLMLDDSQLKIFNDLLKDADILTYSSKEINNYTTCLSITINEKTNDIYFSKADPPEDMPESIKKLIDEIIKTHK